LFQESSAQKQFNIYEFINECLALSGSFDVMSFLEAFAAASEPFNDEKLASVFNVSTFLLFSRKERVILKNGSYL
jgi:hypothetical protein